MRSFKGRKLTMFEPLTQESCAEKLKYPIVEVGQNWNLKGKPELKTAGITELIAKLNTKYRILKSGKIIPNIEKQPNHLFEFSHTVIVKGLIENLQNDEIIKDMHLSWFVGVSETETLIEKYRRVEKNGFVTKKEGKALWDESRLHLHLGNKIDNIMKNIFNNTCSKETLENLPSGVKGLVAMCYKVLHLKPIMGGVKVAIVQSGHSFEKNDPRYCCDICNREYVGTIPVTEIDLVGYDPKEKQCVLIELKTFKNNFLDKNTLNKYNHQAWLSWMGFSATFPHLRHATRSIIIVVSVSSGLIQVYNVRPPPVTKRFLTHFPIIKSMCPRKYKSYTPTIAVPKIKSSFITGKLNKNGDIEISRAPNEQKLCQKRKIVHDLAVHETTPKFKPKNYPQE